MIVVLAAAAASTSVSSSHPPHPPRPPPPPPSFPPPPPHPHHPLPIHHNNNANSSPTHVPHRGSITGDTLTPHHAPPLPLPPSPPISPPPGHSAAKSTGLHNEGNSPSYMAYEDKSDDDGDNDDEDGSDDDDRTPLSDEEKSDLEEDLWFDLDIDEDRDEPVLKVLVITVTVAFVLCLMRAHCVGCSCSSKRHHHRIEDGSVDGQTPPTSPRGCSCSAAGMELSYLPEHLHDGYRLPSQLPGLAHGYGFDDRPLSHVHATHPSAHQPHPLDLVVDGSSRISPNPSPLRRPPHGRQQQPQQQQQRRPMSFSQRFDVFSRIASSLEL